jgi:hypothetical protein
MGLRSEAVCHRQVKSINLLILCCKHALRFANLATVEHSLRCAHRSYAAALRNAGRLSFTVAEADTFENSTMQLEAAIVELSSLRDFLQKMESARD